MPYVVMHSDRNNSVKELPGKYDHSWQADNRIKAIIDAQTSLGGHPHHRVANSIAIFPDNSDIEVWREWRHN